MKHSKNRLKKPTSLWSTSQKDDEDKSNVSRQDEFQIAAHVLALFSSIANY